MLSNAIYKRRSTTIVFFNFFAKTRFLVSSCSKYFSSTMDSSLIVEVKQGKLQGKIQKSVFSGSEYCSFSGIPFAKPPVNELRFQSPVPAEKWSEEVFDATKNASPCIQFDLGSGKFIGSEDCLYLNVYTPKPPKSITSPKAVMVFIHGGGFVHGTALQQSYSADYLIDYDVILVTVAYRLHALGFLNMGTANNAGNCGLRDQLLALKWVRENIIKFGGDDKNITIFGESAGSSSVHFQMLSPLSKGTFNKAILQSGISSCPWSLNKNPKENGFLLGKKMGFQEQNAEKLVEFLKTQSAEDICGAVQVVYNNLKSAYVGRTDYLVFIPSVEENTELAFLPDHPSVLMKTATPVPIIVGLNNKEGRLAFFGTNTSENYLKSCVNAFDSLVANEMKIESLKIPHNLEQVKKFCFGDKIDLHNVKDQIVDLYTDIFFKNFYDSFDFVTSSSCPVYVYEFVFYGRFNWYTNVAYGDTSLSSGASHGDELPYLFYRKRFVEGDFTEPELTVIKNMCTLWSNFAKTGNPSSTEINFEWKPSTSNEPYFAQIDRNLTLHSGTVLSERAKFWNKFSKNT